MPANSDFEDLLRTFKEFGVKYLIVGGYALFLYTEPRYTKDLDIWVEASPENADRCMVRWLLLALRWLG